MPQDFALHLIEALALGFGTGLLLWLLRNFAAVRRFRLSLMLGVIMAGLILVVRGTHIMGEALALQVFTAAGVMFVAHACLQLFDWFVWDYWLERRRHMAVPRLLVDLFNFIVLTAVAVTVLGTVFQVNLSALLVTSTVVSAVIGLALQDILGNVVAGLALQLERPFNVGEWVQVSDQEGQVLQMNWRTLTVRTRDHHTVIVPNSNVAKQEIVNYSRPTSLQRIHVYVNVSYRHPPGLVKESILRAVADVDGVRADPPPEVIVQSFGDFAIHYDLRLWIDDYARLPLIADAAYARIWYALRRDGIEIPVPMRDVTMRMLSDDHATRLQEQTRGEIYSELRGLPVFKPLSDEQIKQLAQRAAIQRYGEGEVLVKQGDTAQSLYTIKAGRVRVDVRNEQGQVRTVATLGQADFFGEMSLLTGEPRTASVIAQTETEVVVVDKMDFAAVLESDATIVDALSMALEDRLKTLAANRTPEAASLPLLPAPQRAALISRIRGFLGLK